MRAMRFLFKSLFITIGFLAAAAQAAPVAISLTGAMSVQAYSGSAAVNAGNLDISDNLFYIREQQVGGVQSWYLFYDPQGRANVQATLDFGAPILDVITTSRGLADSVGTYGVDVDGDGVFDDYATRTLMGLENGDTVNWTLGGSTLAINWSAIDPGDHVRVLVQAVPEPGSLALAALALGGLLLTGRRARTKAR